MNLDNRFNFDEILDSNNMFSIGILDGVMGVVPTNNLTSKSVDE